MVTTKQSKQLDFFTVYISRLSHKPSWQYYYIPCGGKHQLMQLLIHCKNEVAVLSTWWLLQLHYVDHVGNNTVIYPVE